MFGWFWPKAKDAHEQRARTHITVPDQRPPGLTNSSGWLSVAECPDCRHRAANAPFGTYFTVTVCPHCGYEATWVGQWPTMVAKWDGKHWVTREENS